MIQGVTSLGAKIAVPQRQDADMVGSAQSVPEITRQLSEMDRQTSELGAMLDGLRGRLSPVLSPSLPSKNETQVPNHPRSSEIGSVIGDFNDRIRNMQGVLRDLFDRLAI